MRFSILKKAILFAVISVIVLSATGCDLKSGFHLPGNGRSSSSRPSNLSKEEKWTAEEDRIVDFYTLSGTDRFRSSNGYSNGGMFDCTWRSSCAVLGDGKLTLTDKTGWGGYEGGEYRSYSWFSYGYFSVSMKAADCSGVISSFFTYNSNPVWDEIDIEFLGKDVTKVQFNYYTNGQGGHEYRYDLGFDASKDFHEYGFDWQPDYIEWYVDGKAVYRATKDIPSHAGMLMANVWNGKGEGFADWAGALDQTKLPASAEYKWFAYKGND